MSVPAPPSRERKDEDLLTPAEVAEIFRVDPKTVTRWAAADPPKLSSVRTPGGHRRFRWSVVRAKLREDQGERSLSRKPVITVVRPERAVLCWRGSRRKGGGAAGREA
jgi:hypothetical protein